MVIACTFLHKLGAASSYDCVHADIALQNMSYVDIVAA